jgi:hypothetical protein
MNSFVKVFLLPFQENNTKNNSIPSKYFCIGTVWIHELQDALQLSDFSQFVDAQCWPQWSSGYHTCHWTKGSNPAKENEFLRVIKICSMTSFGGEVKTSAPCCKAAECEIYFIGTIHRHFSSGSPELN